MCFGSLYLLSSDQPLQVKVAEHVLSGHKVAIKILNRKKIQAMDMDEKGEQARMCTYMYDRTEGTHHLALSFVCYT
jgi:hypothetical protein